MRTDAELEQAGLSIEIDIETARLIREEGVPIYDALERAWRIVARRRRAATASGFAPGAKEQA